jgi:hypothetical protein
MFTVLTSIYSHVLLNISIVLLHSAS